ncbi:uncharacterized protein LOC119907982 isoform X2 [Micropterus salmoides]|uniref:uncharacterized protein LOC119907982 isoform X2 n=1 Tax=Micropterus salmoides TaxID=27706 RepID=UPI0018EA6EC1|nr:uncharacterized protein LOC119907982 isoform X2 [Micropterus salmoides]
MRMKIYSCLLAFVLCCNVSAEKKHKIIRQKDSVTLPCPHPVEGKVTWSREKNGNRVDILTVDGDRDIRHIHDPLKRYSSSADKSLHISRAAVSDAGTYFCNNEAAVELTVLQGRKEPTTTTTTPPPLTRQTTSEPLPAATTAPSTPLVNTGTSTVSTTQPAISDQPSEYRRLLYGVVSGMGAILLLVFIILLILLFTKRYRSDRRGLTVTPVKCKRRKREFWAQMQDAGEQDAVFDIYMNTCRSGSSYSGRDPWWFLRRSVHTPVWQSDWHT